MNEVEECLTLSKKFAPGARALKMERTVSTVLGSEYLWMDDLTHTGGTNRLCTTSDVIDDSYRNSDILTAF